MKCCVFLNKLFFDMSVLRLSAGGVSFRHRSCVAGHGPGIRVVTCLYIYIYIYIYKDKKNVYIMILLIVKLCVLWYHLFLLSLFANIYFCVCKYFLCLIEVNRTRSTWFTMDLNCMNNIFQVLKDRVHLKSNFSNKSWMSSKYYSIRINFEKHK